MWLVLVCVVCVGFAAHSNPKALAWEIQANSSSTYFQTVSMCKGTSTGFVGNNLGTIFRTLDGKTWEQVADISDYGYWYGLYCFPGNQKVIAVGFSDGDPNYENNAMFVWSQDGGGTWSDRNHLTGDTWLQSVSFHNETHGVILPIFNLGSQPVFYYTTTGGLLPEDWKIIHVPERYLYWPQTHALWNFGGPVMKSLALSGNHTLGWSDICTSTNYGYSWDCTMSDPFTMNVVSFVSETDAIGVAFIPKRNALVVYSTKDGGNQWKEISQLPTPLANAVLAPTDLLWIPNSKAVFMVGGTDYPNFVGGVLQSLDGGITWEQAVPSITETWFTSVDYTMSSESTAEVYVIGAGNNNYILHATIQV